MKTTIQYCSDLHLDFSNNLRYFKALRLKPIGEVLILAGDILELNNSWEQNWFFNFCSENFKLTLYIPGNHEFYHNDLLTEYGFHVNYKIKENVFLINNDIFSYKDITFILSSLWSKINPTNGYLIQKNISDFEFTVFKGEFLIVDDVNELFNHSFLFLSKSIVETKGKKIVVTHTLPSTKCNHQQFKNGSLNEFFCVDLSNFIIDNPVDYWIYGHSHRNMELFKLGETTMLTNQLGYVGSEDCRTFNNKITFKI